MAYKCIVNTHHDISNETSQLFSILESGIPLLARDGDRKLPGYSFSVILGMDYRKSLVFLAGYGLNENNVRFVKDDYVKALMIEPEMINDPYVRRNIYSMIKKRIDCAKKGSIKVNANYAMISGDPYALCQSMFGLEVTGLLKAGEVYHKYWIDKRAEEIVCFRAPMTASNNIRKMKLCDNEDTRHWFQYIKTALIYNAWDTACEAMNGADKDRLKRPCKTW